MKDKLSVFSYIQYKEYLVNLLASRGRGGKSKLASRLGCQSGFISQVLGGTAHFSQEHIIKIISFLELSEEEGDFLMLLLNYSRSGSQELSSYYLQRINKIKKERERIKSLIKPNTQITDKESQKYYSKWYYSAIYVCTSIEELSTPNLIARKLKLDESTVREALGFLESIGLVKKEEERYFVHDGRVHLGSDSPLITLHHTNWRLQAIKSFEEKKEDDKHYSSVFSLSAESYIKLKNEVLSFIKSSEEILIDSDDEQHVCSLCIDFFEI